MLHRYAIALAGLPLAEKTLIEALLLLGFNRQPAFAVVQDPARAALIIANADDELLLRMLQEWSSRPPVLLVGSSDAGTGWPRVERPLQLATLVEAVRRLGGPALQAPAPGAWVDELPAASEPWDAADPASDETEPVPLHGADTLPVPLAETDQPAGALPPAALPAIGQRILLVGPPGPAVGELLTTLMGYGYPADFADGPEAALRRLGQEAYRWVFLIDGVGLDASTLCRRIRAQCGATPAGPLLVIVSSRRSPFSRFSAHRAGCDAYLPVPLNREALLAYLQTASDLEAEPA
jgi:CheY-like chemotaxis protein